MAPSCLGQEICFHDSCQCDSGKRGIYQCNLADRLRIVEATLGSVFLQRGLSTLKSNLDLSPCRKLLNQEQLDSKKLILFDSGIKGDLQRAFSMKVITHLFVFLAENPRIFM